MTLILILSGVFTLVVITIGILKCCNKKTYLTARSRSYQPTDSDNYEEPDSAYDVYISNNDKL